MTTPTMSNADCTLVHSLNHLLLDDSDSSSSSTSEASMDVFGTLTTKKRRMGVRLEDQSKEQPKPNPKQNSIGHFPTRPTLNLCPPIKKYTPPHRRDSPLSGTNPSVSAKIDSTERLYSIAKQEHNSTLCIALPKAKLQDTDICLLYTSPSPRDA